MEQKKLYDSVRKSFENQAFLTLIGAKLEHVEPGTVTVSCRNRPDLLQQQGLLHGGVITALADVACGYAALICMPEGSEVLTVELKINLMRPAAAPNILAAGQVLKAEKTLVIAESTVSSEDGTFIAKMLSTMIAAKKD